MTERCYGITATSCLFLASAMYAFTTHQYVLACVTFLVFLSSIIHWMNYRDMSWIHVVDRCVAFGAFMVYIVYGATVLPPFTVGLMIHSIMTAYLLSDLLSRYKNPLWKCGHMYFHVLGNVCLYRIMKLRAINDAFSKKKH